MAKFKVGETLKVVGGPHAGAKVKVEAEKAGGAYSVVTEDAKQAFDVKEAELSPLTRSRPPKG